MNDWVHVSARTRWYMMVATTLWVFAVVCGSLSSSASGVMPAVAWMAFLLFTAISVGAIWWTALRPGTDPYLRAGWLTVGAGELVALLGGVRSFTAIPWFAATDGTVSWVAIVGCFVTGVGAVLLATSVGSAHDRGRTLLRALALAIAMFVVMMAALLAPGPNMPFAMGPRDVDATWRLLIDCGLILLPMTYAILTQLRLPNGQRARAWLWVAAGALILAMGDVGAALLDLGTSQVYPWALWELGLMFMTIAALIAADVDAVERSGAALREGADRLEGAAAPSEFPWRTA